jgi:hypothetical protein
LSHKILGNEEFCLQIDAHTAFVQDWDEKLKQEWAATGNEFGIISTVPPGFAAKDKDVHTQNVPRSCVVTFEEVGIPVSALYCFVLLFWSLVVWIVHSINWKRDKTRQSVSQSLRRIYEKVRFFSFSSPALSFFLS